MEDRNSWDDLIFYHINARSEWLSSLIWRNRQKLNKDISEDENDDAGKKKKVNLDPSNKEMIDWFNERQKNFKKNAEEETESSEEKTETPISTNGQYRIVEEPAICEAGDLARAPHLS